MYVYIYKASSKLIYVENTLQTYIHMHIYIHIRIQRTHLKITYIRIYTYTYKASVKVIHVENTRENVGQGRRQETRIENSPQSRLAKIHM